MNANELHDPETFGSWTGKTAPEVLINLQLLFDHNRIWILSTAIILNHTQLDATIDNTHA